MVGLELGVRRERKRLILGAGVGLGLGPGLGMRIGVSGAGAGLGVGLVRCTSSAGTTKKWLLRSYSCGAWGQGKAESSQSHVIES